MHSIGDLSRQTGAKTVTIRYYEKIGLLPKPPRTAGNYRAYDGALMRRLSFIRRCHELGFTLAQVRAMLSLSERKHQDCGDVDRIATEHLAEVEEKIASLSRLADELRRLNACCKGGKVADCRIIEALSPA